MTKKKNNGLLRLGAILPFTVLIILIVVFNILFLDVSIKKTIEFAGESINKAEVNVAEVKTSFSDLSVEVRKIEFTDKENPDFNSFEIGTIQVSVLWDALLRAKLVINNIDVKDIKVQTKRNSKGFIVKEEKSISSENKKVKEVLSKTKEANKKNVLGDVAGVLNGDSATAIPKDIEGDLESKKKFKELEVKAENASADIKKDINNLPTKEDIQTIEKRISKVNWNDLTNPKKAKSTLDEINEIKEDIDNINKRVSKVKKSVSQKTKELDEEYKNAEKLVSQDIDAVAKRMNLPQIDQKAIAGALFGKDIVSKMEEFQGYYFMAKKYFPPKKKDKEAPIPRGSGSDYRFGTPNSYPLLWVKSINVNSENNQGFLKGNILNITTNQRLINKYTTAKLEGDFPEKNIRNLNLDATLDFKDNESLRIKSTIGSLPVLKKSLIDSKEASFTINKASNRVEVKALLKAEGPDLNIKNSMTHLELSSSANSKQLNEVLEDVVKKTKLLTLDASGRGSWDSIKFDIKSNLASAIQNSVSSLVQEKIDAKKAEIKKKVEAQIADSKKAITSKLDGIKGQAQSAIKTGEDQLKKLTKSIDKNKKKNSSKNLLKGFKL